MSWRMAFQPLTSPSPNLSYRSSTDEVSRLPVEMYGGSKQITSTELDGRAMHRKSSVPTTRPAGRCRVQKPPRP